MPSEDDLVDLPESEINALKDIETICLKKIKLRRVEAISVREKNKRGKYYRKHQLGFLVRRKHVVSLGLAAEYDYGFKGESKKNLKQKLTKLPDSISNLSHLEYLDLYRNSFSNLPDAIGELIRLKSINLEDNSLISLPDTLSGAEKLIRLNIASNDIRNLGDSFKVISKLKNLKTLNLKNNMLEKLPNWIGNCDMIENIDLSLNNIIDLPKSFGSLKNIMKIDISANNLSLIPSAICELTNLQKLNLKQNNLIEIPENIGNLKNLENLNTSSNQIVNIADSIGNLKKLKMFVLTNNLIEELPKSIGFMHSLRKLYIHGNKLKNLPKSISSLPMLESLDLSSNLIERIPMSFRFFKSLDKIKLDNNPLIGEDRKLINRDARSLLDYLRKKTQISIFISHAIVDYEYFNIKEIDTFLEEQQEIYKCTYCEEDLVGDIDKFMEENLKNAHLMLFMASDASIRSKDCLHELDLANSYEVPVIPIKNDEVSWDELKSVGLSRTLGIDYDENDLDSFLNDLYNYILQYKRDVNLFEKTRAKIDNVKRELKDHILEIITSKKYDEFVKNKLPLIKDKLDNLDEKLKTHAKLISELMENFIDFIET